MLAARRASFIDKSTSGRMVGAECGREDLGFAMLAVSVSSCLRRAATPQGLCSEENVDRVGDVVCDEEYGETAIQPQVVVDGFVKTRKGDELR